VIGKKADEVLLALGQPDRTAEDGSPTWYYERRTTNEKGVDVQARVIFLCAAAARVEFD
jgi:outer membrane protein assembly factor BamE (lipoprotein component of BamABCDE complex)